MSLATEADPAAMAPELRGQGRQSAHPGVVATGYKWHHPRYVLRLARLLQSAA